MPATDALAGDFEAVAFSSEIADLSPPQVLRKWTGPIRIKFGGPGAARHETAIRRNAAELGALTGLTYEFVAPDAPGENFVVLFTPAAGMAAAGGRFVEDRALVERIVADSRGGCYFLTFHKKGC